MSWSDFDIQVLPPPPPPKPYSCELSPTLPKEFTQLPSRTPIETIEKLYAFYVNGKIQELWDMVDSLRSNPSPEGFDINSLYPVRIAAIKRDDVKFIRDLYSHGASTSHGNSYTWEAVKAKSKNILELFLEEGWDLNKPLGEVRPPILSEAVEDEDMTTWLLNHGADPNQQSSIDRTPLSYAVESGPMSVIKLMLDRGGDIHKGQVFHHAVFRKSESEIIELLTLFLERGLPLNATMYQDHPKSWGLYFFMGLGTTLHLAAQMGKLEVICFLHSRGADTTIKDANGRTALECAKWWKQPEAAKLLESFDSPVITSVSESQTALIS